MIGTIIGAILFVLIIAACCCSDSGSSSSGSTTPKRNVNTSPGRNAYYGPSSYCECPSCGAPYYDGYCEECGYPDINQGWLGEEYG